MIRPICTTVFLAIGIPLALFCQSFSPANNGAARNSSAYGTYAPVAQDDKRQTPADSILLHLQQLSEQGDYRALLQQYHAHRQFFVEQMVSPAKWSMLYALLSTARARLGNYETAIRLKDSLIFYQNTALTHQKSAALAALAARYPIDEARAQRRELEQQRIRQEMAINRQQQNFSVIITALILLLAIGGFLMILRTRQKRYQKELEQAVAEHKKDLREKNQQLQGYNKDLQAFYRSTSHDLVEPLRNITSFAGLLERYYRQQQQQTRESAARNLKAASKQMHQLVVRLPELLGVKH